MRGTLRSDPAAGGREGLRHAGRDQVQARGGAEGHTESDINKAHLYAPIEVEQYVDSALERAQQSCCATSTDCGLLPAGGSGSTLRPWRRRDLCHRLPRSALSSTPARRVRIVVHGDDFVIEGGQEHLDWTKGVLANMYLVKVSSILGSECQDDKVADILNRVAEWRDDEVWWEADPRHVEKMLEDIGLEDCKPGGCDGLHLFVISATCLVLL